MSNKQKDTKQVKIQEQNQINDDQYSNNNEDQEKFDNQELKDSKNFEKAATLPVREQLEKLEEIMVQVQKDLEESSKSMNSLNSDITLIKQKYAGAEGELDFINRTLTNEKNRLTVDLRKGAEKYMHENDFLQQQLNQLFDDKQKLDETSQLLDLRTQGVETDVGFRFVYD